MARHPARDHARPRRAARNGRVDRRLQRLRSLGAVAPCRPPGADLRAPPAAAARRPARGRHRRRDRDDRRSVGSLHGAEPPRPRDPRSECREHPHAARTVPRLHARHGRGGHGQQPRLAGRAQPRRLPARHRQALHDPVHARQGLGPGQAGAGAVVHRVQLHAAAGLRLRPPARDDGRGAADGRRGPVGQHHRRPGTDTPNRRRRRRQGAGSWPRLQAAAQSFRRQVREERRGGVGLARSGPDHAVCLLPVLAQHR